MNGRPDRPRKPDGVDLPDRGPERAGTAPYGWRPLAVLSAVVLLSGINSNITAGTLPLLTDEFGIPDWAAGGTETGKAIASLALALPAGYVADRYPRARLIALVLAGAAAMTLGSVFATSFLMLFLARTLLAAEGSVDEPPAASLLGDYYAPRARARAYGLHRMCYFAGISLGTVVGGTVGEALGWSGAYAVTLVPALVLAVLCWRLPEPVRGALDAPTARPSSSPHHPGAAPRPFPRQIADFVGNRPLLLLAVAVGALFLGSTAFSFWSPSYYVREYGLGTGAAASLAAVIDLSGIVAGTLVGSWLGDRWSARRPGAHVYLGGIALLSGSATLLTGLAMPSLGAQATVFVVAVLLFGVGIPNLTAGLADLQPSSSRGTGFAIVQVLTTCGAAVGPLTAGAVSDATGSLTLGLAAVAAVMLTGGLLTLLAHFLR